MAADWEAAAPGVRAGRVRDPLPPAVAVRAAARGPVAVPAGPTAQR
ncbi:hypothetical protein [Mycobacterium kyorinense]|nr:hypothetical protein [Mycobacterium kyorinense]